MDLLQNLPDSGPWANHQKDQRSNSPKTITQSLEQIKPILSSRDIWIFHQHSEASKITRAYSKSLRSITIEHRCSGQQNNGNMRRMSKAIGNNKYLQVLDMKKHSQYPAQLKYFIGRIKKLNHLKNFKVNLNCSSYTQQIRHFAYFLRCLGDLTTLELELSLLDYGFPKLRQGKQRYGLRNLRHLTSLTIFVSQTYIIEAQDMELILSNIRHCQYLQRLTLDFGCCLHLSTEAVCMLASALQNLQFLTKLNLNFQRCKRLDEKALNSLNSCLESLQKIVSLKLNFVECLTLDSTSIVLLSKNLRTQNHLKILDYAFPYYQNVRKGINEFFQELVHVQPLLSLKIRIAFNPSSPNPPLVISEDFFRNFGRVLKIQNQLKILGFKLEHAELEGSWAQPLAEGFQGLQSLSKLSFTLKHSKSLNDQIAKDLREALSKLKSLSALKLNFYENHFSHEGIKEILEGVTTLNNLKEMDLNLDNRKSTSFILQQVKSFIPFFKSLEIKSLNSVLNSLQENLEALKLDLALFHSAAQDLSFFAESLASMKQLSTLRLQFNKVNDSKKCHKGLEDIFSSFKKIHRLTNLELIIQNGSDEDLRSFLISLKGCRKIESLMISFPIEKAFSSNTAHQFIEAMGTLEKLYKISLNIFFRDNQDQEVSVFWTGIKKLKSLSILHFNFGNTVIGYSPVEFLENWKSIKTLKTLEFF